MPNIKKKLEPLTAWITYEFELPLTNTAIELSEPVIKLRLRPLDILDGGAELVDHGMNKVRASIAMALQAVAEWDLSDSGKPIPVDEETKARYLRPLLAEMVKDRETEKSRPLAYVIVEDAQDQKLFRKN